MYEESWDGVLILRKNQRFYQVTGVVKMHGSLHYHEVVCRSMYRVVERDALWLSHAVSARVAAFAIPVGMLPVNVVGSYGAGTAYAKRVGAGQHPLPSGVGVPVRGSSLKQNTWTCMVLLYGTGAAVQYEGMGHCGVGNPTVGVQSAVCQIPLPHEDGARSGVMRVGWCTPTTKKKKRSSSAE
jgi:hypothetical protein